MVPPRGRMPDVLLRSSSTVLPSITPAQPERNPTASVPWTLTALRTTPRMTALRPGQSPPPVRMPTRAMPRIVCTLLVLLLAQCGGDGETERSEPQPPAPNAEHPTPLRELAGAPIVFSFAGT